MSLNFGGALATINDASPVPCNVLIDYERIDVSTECEADPNWSVVDEHGHFHAYDKGGELPTLNRSYRFVPHGCGACDYDEDHRAFGYRVDCWECVICDEEVKPGTRSGSGRTIPGRQTVTVTVPVALDYGADVSLRLDIGGRRLLFGVAACEGSSYDSSGVSSRLVMTRVGARGTPPRPLLSGTAGDAVEPAPAPAPVAGPTPPDGPATT